MAIFLPSVISKMVSKLSSSSVRSLKAWTHMEIWKMNIKLLAPTNMCLYFKKTWTGKVFMAGQHPFSLQYPSIMYLYLKLPALRHSRLEVTIEGWIGLDSMLGMIVIHVEFQLISTGRQEKKLGKNYWDLNSFKSPFALAPKSITFTRQPSRHGVTWLPTLIMALLRCRKWCEVLMMCSILSGCSSLFRATNRNASTMLCDSSVKIDVSC